MTTTEPSHGSFWVRCAGSTPRDRRNLTRALWMYLAWTVLFVGGSQLLKRDLVPGAVLPWAIAVVPSAFALFVLLAWGRFLREADELQRSIHLGAMALAFGATFLGVSGYRILERAGAPVADITDASIFLALFYALGIVRGMWRYR